MKYSRDDKILFDFCLSSSLEVYQIESFWKMAIIEVDY